MGGELLPDTSLLLRYVLEIRGHSDYKVPIGTEILLNGDEQTYPLIVRRLYCRQIGDIRLANQLASTCAPWRSVPTHFPMICFKNGLISSHCAEIGMLWGVES